MLKLIFFNLLGVLLLPIITNVDAGAPVVQVAGLLMWLTACIQLALGESLLHLIFSHFSFLDTCAYKYLLFIFLWFLVVTILGLSKTRKTYTKILSKNISSLTNVLPEVFESCLWTQQTTLRSLCLSFCRSVYMSLIIKWLLTCFSA